MAELEADIARTREELADTVDQLAAKLDVKTRIRNRVTEAKDAATAQVQSARQHLVGVDGKPRPATLSVGGAVARGHRSRGACQAVDASLEAPQRRRRWR